MIRSAGRVEGNEESRYISQPFSCVPEKQNKSPSSSADARNEPMMMTASDETKKKSGGRGGGKGGVSVVWPRRRESRYIYHLTFTPAVDRGQQGRAGRGRRKQQQQQQQQQERLETRARERERDNAAKGRGTGRALPKKEG
jgi:hypothetical protein